MARGERLARPRCGDQQKIRPGLSGMPVQERRLPSAQCPGWRAGITIHDVRPPLRRLQLGHSALPFAGVVTPPARTGITWSACHPGPSAAPHSAHRPRAARNSATRVADPNRREAIARSVAWPDFRAICPGRLPATRSIFEPWQLPRRVQAAVYLPVAVVAWVLCSLILLGITPLIAFLVAVVVTRTVEVA
jgi:hypothetical protein